MKRSVPVPFWALLSGSVVIFVCGLSLLGWFLSSTYVVNFSGSMAEGVYLRTHDDVARGAIVMFCPSSDILARRKAAGGKVVAGPCASGSVMYLKRVAAVAGDDVLLQARGMTVNGQMIPNSSPVRTPRMRVLQSVAPGRYRVPGGHVWVISESPSGYDSRYYGPVKPETTLVPVLLWKGADR